MQKVAGHAASRERDFDDLDLHIGERDEAMKALDRRTINVERRFVLGRAKTLSHLVILARAQIERRRRVAVARSIVATGDRAHAVGDFDARMKPRFVVFDLGAFQQTPDPVDLAHVGAAPRRRAQHAQDGRRPTVVAGKINEVRRFFFRDMCHMYFR